MFDVALRASIRRRAGKSIIGGSSSPLVRANSGSRILICGLSLATAGSSATNTLKMRFVAHRVRSRNFFLQPFPISAGGKTWSAGPVSAASRETGIGATSWKLESTNSAALTPR